MEDFLSGLVLKTPLSNGVPGVQVQSLAGELRLHIVQWVRIKDFVVEINTLNVVSSYPIHGMNKVLQDQSPIKTLRDHEIPLLEAQYCLERGKSSGNEQGR